MTYWIIATSDEISMITTEVYHVATCMEMRVENPASWFEGTPVVGCLILCTAACLFSTGVWMVFITEEMHGTLINYTITARSSYLKF